MSDNWDNMRKAKEGTYFAKKNRELLKKLKESKEENPRPSPITGEPMVQEDLNGVTIDRCPTSGGIWLDEGELEDLITAALSENKEEHDGLLGFLNALAGIKK